VRVKIQEQHLRIAITTHPLHLVIDDDLYKPIHVSGSGGEWHVEGEFETRRVVRACARHTRAAAVVLLAAHS
jgi:hypothetical protein